MKPPGRSDASQTAWGPANAFSLRRDIENCSFARVISAQ